MLGQKKIRESISVKLGKAQEIVLPILDIGTGWLVVDKPEGVLSNNHLWFPQDLGIAEGLTALIHNPMYYERFVSWLGKMPITHVRSIYQLDPEISGVALFVYEKKLIQQLCNAYGSQQLEFVFQFFTRGSIHDQAERVCDLPIASHFSESRMMVSHQSGKKTRTHFRFIKNWGPISLWEARTHYLRHHQVRLHAFEVGLPILGENIYANEPPIYLSQLKRLKKIPETEMPICSGLSLHLAQVSWDARFLGISMPNSWISPLRPKMNVLIKKLATKYEKHTP